ncbi:hypothetical protein Bca4012_042633 [Brassica carinata]
MKFTGNQVLQRDIFFFFAFVAVFAQPAKQSSHQTTSPKVNQISEQKNRAWSFSVLVYLRVEEEKVLKCVLVNHTGSHSKIHHTEEEEDSASGIIPPLQPEATDDDVAEITPTEVEVVEISDEEEEDMVELSCEEYMRNMGYLIRMGESEDDIEPEYRRMLHRMHEEEKKLRQGIKVEEEQSSKSKKRKRRR